MILYYIVLFFSFFLFALVIRFNRFVFHAVAENSVALVNELISDIDEDAKISSVQKTTNRLLLSMLKMFLVILFSFSPVVILVFIYSLVSGTEFQSLNFSSFYSILSLSLGATLPFLIPFKKKNHSAYSELSQLLHRMALNNYYISNKLFQQEKKKIRRKKLERRNDFVIISGLARAGTTSLMNDLSKMEDFVSLNYANMPFLLSPNIWAKFYKPKAKNLKERSHKDGIMIGLNSNEALEEYFFKVKANDSYIKDNYLTEYSISREDYNDYLDYQSIVKLDNNKIYLAKNNNFILRYQSVREFNDGFIMVIMYRDPLTHAASLMEKHKDYLKLQTEDPFVLEYMDWLGHHEFGKKQKPFLLNDTNLDIPEGKESMDYWLKIWINYYSHALSINHPNTLFINYDSYCKNPGDIIKTIASKTGAASKIPEYHPFYNKRKVEMEYSNDVYEEAIEIYDKLKSFDRQ